MKQTLPTIEMEPGAGGYGEAPEVKAEAKKAKSFSSAFRDARKAGDKTFLWNGKRYTTDTAPAKGPAPAGEPGGARRGEGRGYKLSDVTRPGTRVTYDNTDTSDMTYKRGGKVKGYAMGGSASSRADGCAQRGKTRGKVL
jgi:hypothetical protein